MKQGHWDRCLMAVAGALLSSRACEASQDVTCAAIRQNGNKRPHIATFNSELKERVSLWNR